MANQYVANTTVGIDFPIDKEPGTATAWYDKGEVITAAHADAANGRDELQLLVNNGSVLVQTIRDPEQELPSPAEAKE